MTRIFVDADACPVKDETLRVATRYEIETVMVSDGGIRPYRDPLVENIYVEPGSDAADDWIAENIGPGDICITNDIPLAGRCLEAGAQALRPDGEVFSQDNIGMALATRELMKGLRETGEITGGPKPFSRADRSRFLDSLDRLARPLAFP